MQFPFLTRERYQLHSARRRNSKNTHEEVAQCLKFISTIRCRNYNRHFTSPWLKYQKIDTTMTIFATDCDRSSLLLQQHPSHARNNDRSSKNLARRKNYTTIETDENRPSTQYDSTARLIDTTLMGSRPFKIRIRFLLV